MLQSVSEPVFKRSMCEVASDCLPHLVWHGLQVLEAYALNEPPPEFDLCNDETRPDTNGMKTQMDAIISFRVCCMSTVVRYVWEAPVTHMVTGTSLSRVLPMQRRCVHSTCAHGMPCIRSI